MLKDALDGLLEAVKNLEIAARSDDKTPLRNSLALNEAKDLFGTSENEPNVLVFADINDFKFINGEYGYENGDAAINQIGIKLQELIVEKCKAQAFRQSGDEFVILLNKDFLSDFMENLNYFDSCPVSGIGHNFRVSLSFGYVITDGEYDFEILKSRAETACKQAKREEETICIEWTEEIEKNSIENFRKNCPKCNAVTACYIPKNTNLNLQFCAACGNNFN